MDDVLSRIVQIGTGAANHRQLKWYDRTGKMLGVLGDPDDSALLAPRLSPDGRRAVANRSDRNGRRQPSTTEVVRPHRQDARRSRRPGRQRAARPTPVSRWTTCCRESFRSERAPPTIDN